ncbi:MAG: 2-amino-4-hydroxy-6-hydroxymethyldihydropteridine diphosphokinase [Candidatus Omnitrophica bacterium]|nr:2-amino-4-hydroxy-6-hydroxymethyldihydropteridine diphosphokinase [Candidatus Omnitrophota bacterium]
MFICYLGIGSNLGQRRENIELAVKKINSLKSTKVIKLSGIIETKPQGGPPQPKFLNAALKIKTGLAPLTLLKKLKNIEQELGRIKTVRNGPRAIDLDILLYADKIIKRKELIVPHPRMFERDFVIRPLSEVI